MCSMVGVVLPPAGDACRAFRFSSRMLVHYFASLIIVYSIFLYCEAHISHLSVVVIKDCAQARSIKEVPPVAPVRTRSPSITAYFNKMTVFIDSRWLIKLMSSNFNCCLGLGSADGAGRERRS